MSKLNEKISLFRKNIGMTQTELGAQLCVSPQAVSKWERGESEPDVGTLIRMAEIFHVTLDELMKDSSESAASTPSSPQNTTIVRTETKIIYGYCEECKKPVGPDEYEVSKVGDTQHIYCKSCAAERAAKARRTILKEEKHELRRGLILGSIAAVIAALAIIFCTDFTVSMIPWLLVGMYASFGFVAQMGWVGMICDVFLWFTTTSLHFPGLIFSFDIDGILWAIAMKILFGILSFLFGIFFTLLGVVVCLGMSIFTFPFSLGSKIHECK